MRRICSGSGQLLEQVGEALVVHRRGELAALGERHVADHLGDLGRVQVAQPGRFGGDRADLREQPGTSSTSTRR